MSSLRSKLWGSPLAALLWKNFLLKRNSPWVTVFELATPLVLFFLLVGLRIREPVSKSAATYFQPQPLPSAGMVAVLQEFCPSSDGADIYGYPIHKKASIGPFLDHIHHVWANQSILSRGLNVSSSFQNFNRSWNKYNDFSANANHAKGIQVKTLIKNVTEFQSFLVHNLSLSDDQSNHVLQSNIDYNKLFSSVKSTNIHRSKRNVESNLEKPLPGLQSMSRNKAYSDNLEVLDLFRPLLLNQILSSKEEDFSPGGRMETVKTLILSPSNLHHIICASSYNPSQPHKNLTHTTVEDLCSKENSSKFDSLSSELKQQLNTTALWEDVSMATQQRYPSNDFQDNLNTILSELDELRLISSYIHSLSMIIQIIPMSDCDDDGQLGDDQQFMGGSDNKTQQYFMFPVSNSTAFPPLLLNKTQTPVKTTTEKPKSPQEVKKESYIALWAAMQPILCGDNKPSPHRNLTNFHLTDRQKYNLGVLIHVLTSNPKILYAPNNTQADDVIRKANTSFAIIGNITDAAIKWRNVSKQIRQTLNDPNVDKTMNWLQKTKQSYKQDPELVLNLTTGYPLLQKYFESNQTLPNKTSILTQLDEIDAAACSWQKFVSGISINWFKGFKSEDEAVKYATTQAYQDNASVFATLVFDVDTKGKLKNHVVYKIRQNASFTQDTSQIRLSYWRPDPYNWDFKYYDFGFVWLQDIIERSIMWEFIGHDVVSPGTYIHEMPYPCYIFDVFSMDLEHIMPLAMILSWVYTVAMLVQHIVYEKEGRLKEVMKIMGLSNGVHLLAWFISSFLQLQISVTVIALTLKYGNVLGNSNLFIIWLFFSLYAAATIMFCFLLSVLFSKAKVASACSGIIYFLTYLPFAYMTIQEFLLHETIPMSAKICGSLLSTTAFGLGAKYFAMYELSGYGIQWDNIALTPVEGDTFSLFQAMYMLLADVFLYVILTWYIDAVFPGQYGLPRPWYFPFTESYWLGHGTSDNDCCSSWKPWRWWLNRHGNVDDYVLLDTEDEALVENPPANLKLGVKIQKLTKKYKRGKKKAVDKLTFNLYENQITSFLGHNGAGKTSTMSMLTGLIPPTSGTAYVYGHDIRSEMLDIRKSLGMCPQHNVLFDVLTVEEHLWFYARLKGVPADLIAKEMDQFLQDIGLEVKRSCKVQTLSGGMKRKLSVAIAFVGGSRTVILDEPTAGVDPYARRAIWDLIIKYKEGRTILLSTHHMDEADLLGDRIAIISNGQLRCVGSSLFLKSNYGDGYLLTLIKKEASQSENETSAKQQETRVTKFVKEQVPSAIVSSQSNSQISFNLPFESARKGCFQRLFENLPPRMSDLDVMGYGLSDTTLEEVFLKIDDKSRWESEESFGEKDRLKLRKKLRSSPDDTSEPSSSRSSPFIGSLSHVTEEDDDDPMIDVSCDEQVHHGSCDVAMVTLSHEHPVATGDSSRDMMHDDVAMLDLSQNRGPSKSGVWRGLNQQPPDLQTTSDHQQVDDALDWLNSAPSVEVAEHSEESEEHLLDVVFGKSSFTTNAIDQTATSSDRCGVEDNDDVDLIDITETNEGGGSYKLTPFVRNIRIIQGLLTKRFHYAKRNRKAVFYQIMLPALFVIIAMTVALSMPTARDPPPLILSPSQYRNVTQPKGNFIPITDQSILFPITKSDQNDATSAEIKSTFNFASGVGATCVLKHAFNSSFKLELDEANQTAYESEHLKLISEYFDPYCHSSFTWGIPMSQFLPPNPSVDPASNTTSEMGPTKTGEVCSCSKDGKAYICRKNIDVKPGHKVVTGDWLLDITGKYPILQYLMYTTMDYRLHRYGAMSLGEFRSNVNQSFPGWPSPLRKLAVRDSAQVFYNHKGYHSMPIYLNVLNNAIFRANLPRSMGDPAAYGITAINHPMNKTAGAFSLDFLFSGTDVIIAIFIIVAMSFVPASFLVFLVAEKSSRAKHLQFISGTGPVTYWLSNYMWDMLNYFFPALVCISILQIFNLPAYTRGPNAAAVVALFLLYGWSMTPMMYPASFYFQVPSTAYVCMIVLNLFIGITTVVTTFMMSLFRNDNHMMALGKKLESVFIIFPNYNLGRGLMTLTYNEFMNDYYNKIGETDKVRSPFEWDLITRQLVAMAIEGVAGIMITVLFQVKFFIKRREVIDISSVPRRTPNSPEDVDVANERHRVVEGHHDDLITVKKVSKVYSKRQGQVVAVDQLSFGVGRGECFGLLGVNGAGKTTTFSMITGDTEVTCGEIKINGHLVSAGNARERLLAQQTTGYCPQFDALFNELTPIEHLLLYARLRGIPRCDEVAVADWAIKKLDLERHRDKPAGDLSGGNKRKLSVAIALVGNPSLVLLDEPTTGMDPAARRFLWDLILDVTRSGRAVVLTSHSMEECEALCSKLAIMVNGRFECIGPAQHLKNKFGDGYMLTLRSNQPEKVIQQFEDVFPNAVVKEHHYHKVAVQLQCSEDGHSLAQVFKFLEENRASLNIEDYSVSQTTLDDVFVNFAKRQRNAEGDSPTPVWRKALSSMRRRFLSRFSTVPESQQSSVTHSNLHLRGSPESSRLLEDNIDEEDGDQPLYTFDQSMSLSFIDSTC